MAVKKEAKPATPKKTKAVSPKAKLQQEDKKDMFKAPLLQREIETITVPYEDRQIGIDRLEGRGLMVCNIERKRNSSGQDEWVITAKNPNFSNRPEMQFVD